MTYRKWDPKTKAMVIMAGIRGRAVVEICNEYQIPQSMYYRWRDQFLGNMPKVFSDEDNHREKELLKENSRLKKIIGELTIELKKSEEDWL
jgi:transposase-like protein